MTPSIAPVVLFAHTDGLGWAAFLGFIAGCALVIWINLRSKDTELPKLAGATVPQLGDFIDLEKYYDICHGGDWRSNATETVRDVRIIGYVGGDSDEGSKSYMRGRWLVVEHTSCRI